jgi:hypothetical protein
MDKKCDHKIISSRSRRSSGSKQCEKIERSGENPFNEEAVGYKS